VRSSVDVHNYLVERDVPHEVFAAAGRLRWPEKIAAILGLPPADVAKVVVFVGAGGPVAAVVPAHCEPDPELVSRALEEPGLVPASETTATELSGYLVESLPPVGLPKGFRTIVDRSLVRDAVLYLPGGEARAVLKVRGTDLIRATAARVAEIAASAVWSDGGEEP
jgi:prolyl-tRNA editing enzyme YbaK/EbsC (Cys-tRNA(Pro) deacylase)